MENKSEITTKRFYLKIPKKEYKCYIDESNKVTFPVSYEMAFANVGQEAGYMREIGFNIIKEVPDRAVLMHDKESKALFFEYVELVTTVPFSDLRYDIKINGKWVT